MPTTNCLAGMHSPHVSTPVLDIDRSTAVAVKAIGKFGKSTNFHDNFHSYLFVNLSYHYVKMELSLNTNRIRFM
jgi:hypothetical protein